MASARAEQSERRENDFIMDTILVEDLIDANESKVQLHEQYVRNLLAKPSYILNSYRHMKVILDARACTNLDLH